MNTAVHRPLRLTQSNLIGASAVSASAAIDSLSNQLSIQQQNLQIQLRNTNTSNNISGRLNASASSIAIQPIRIIKPTLTASSQTEASTSSLSPSSSPTNDLSPPILTPNMNDFKKLLNNYQMQNVNNLQTTTINNNNLLSNEQHQQQKQNYFMKKIGNYVFLEQPSANISSSPNNMLTSNSNDSFNSAYNIKTKEFFYWKKFNRIDYMKKLEAYHIMQESKSIYKYKELLFDDEISKQDQSSYVYLIFEPHYGDLHLYMKEKKRLEEPEAKFIFKQCVESIKSCHENGIIVRDIKLKKFVFIDSERTKVVLANLEDCLVLDEDAPNDLIKSQQGCPAYVSPEVLNPHQISYSGRLSDSWSLGIILFTLLLGRYPFHHPTITIMFAKIARGKFQIPTSCNLSIDAKFLLRSLIRSTPSERLLPCEILAHNWLKNIDYCRSSTLTTASSSSQQTIKDTLFKSSNFINLNYQKQQLGISLSAPPAINQQQQSTNSSNQIANNNYLSNYFNINEPSTKRIKLNHFSTQKSNDDSNNDDNIDCIVPIFEPKI